MTRFVWVLSIVLLAGWGLPWGTTASAHTYSSGLFSQMKWRPIGPLRGGRARALSGVPSEPNVFYFGNDDGGVWKSTDYGNSWKPIFDQEPTGSIGALGVAWSNPDVIYVGTGESNIRPDQATGMGMYKSTDAGETWQYIGLKNTQDIAWIAVDHHNPNRVFVAALGHVYGHNKQRGIYRSLDGGKTWTKVLYVNAYTSGDQVLIDPANPHIVYATMWQQQQAPWENGQFGGTDGGVYKSTDGGDTWTKLTKGLPKVQQALLAIAPSDPSRLYASVSSGPGAPDGKVALYRSDNGGASWHKVTNDPRPAERIGGGDLPVLTVDPKNPNVVYSCTPVLWKSIDGGTTWAALRGSPDGEDYQHLWINPNHPKIMEVASDQGTIVTVNGGQSWTTWYNQPTAAMYKIGVTHTYPYWVCSGEQDAGSVCVISRSDLGQITIQNWHTAGSQEYAKVAPDPLNSNLIYGGARSGVTLYDHSTGLIANVSPKALRSSDYRTVRTMPLVFSPIDPHRMYFASNVVWQTDNGGQSWKQISPDLTRKTWKDPSSVGKYRGTKPAKPTDRGVVYTLAPSPLNEDLLWAGTDDGLIWVTHDGGKQWKNVTPPQVKPWWRVFSLEASHFNPNVAYAAVNTMWLDQMRPELFRTEDGGKTWTEIDNGITPDAATNVIREDTTRKGLLFAGTETQVWVSFDNGDHWQSLRLNMPAISVRDLKVYDDDLIAATHGRGFWILDDITPLRQIDGRVAKTPVTLYKPEIATRVHFAVTSDMPWRMPSLPNPLAGAIIDYYLAHSVRGPVKLDIYTASGKLVRHYSSADPEKPLNPATLTVSPKWVRPPMNLSTKEGMHRFVWDMHYQPMPDAPQVLDGSQAVKHNTPIQPSSPWVIAGKYTVKLTVDGHTYTQPLTVRMDPRVKTSRAGLASQFKQSMQAYRGSMAASRALKQVRKLERQLGTNGKASGKLAAYSKQLEALSGPKFTSPFARFSYRGPPTLNTVSGTLRGLMDTMQAADRAPTAADIDALDQATKTLGGLMLKWNRLKQEQPMGTAGA